MILQEMLSPAEQAVVEGALRAAVEGGFFPDWEFSTLIGVDRETVRKVHDDWPRRTVSKEDLACAVMGSIGNLVGYPHGGERDIAKYVPGGLAALERTLDKLAELSL